MFVPTISVFYGIVIRMFVKDHPPPHFHAMMAPAVKGAVALEPYVVRVVFADGEIRDVDIAAMLNGPVFEPLRDPAVFAQVTADEYGDTVTWPNGADIDPEVLYGLAEPANEPSPKVTVPHSSARRAVR